MTEKLHGANSKFVFAKNKSGEYVQFCGSRTNWMADVFGQVQNLKYGAGKNDIFFAAFAILDKQNWVDYDDFNSTLDEYNVPKAPKGSQRLLLYIVVGLI